MAARIRVACVHVEWNALHRPVDVSVLAASLAEGRLACLIRVVRRCAYGLLRMTVEVVVACVVG